MFTFFTDHKGFTARIDHKTNSLPTNKQPDKEVYAYPKNTKLNFISDEGFSQINNYNQNYSFINPQLDTQQTNQNQQNLYSPSQQLNFSSNPQLNYLEDKTIPQNVNELQEASKYFKQGRIKLGFTQADVGIALGKLYGKEISQTTVCRFEALQLSVRNMIRLKPLLISWLQDEEKKALNENKNDEFSASSGSEYNPDASDNEVIKTNAKSVLISPDANISSGYLSASNLEYLPKNSTFSASMIPSFFGKERKKRTNIDESSRKVLEIEFNIKKKPSTGEIIKIAESLHLEKETIRIWFCNRRQKEKKLMGINKGNNTCNTVAFIMQNHKKKSQQPAEMLSTDSYHSHPDLIDYSYASYN